MRYLPYADASSEPNVIVDGTENGCTLITLSATPSSSPSIRNRRADRLRLPGTVGFIRDLPEDLVAAFRATLEELADASLLLHVVDSATADCGRRIEAVRRVLREIGIEDDEAWRDRRGRSGSDRQDHTRCKVRAGHVRRSADARSYGPPVVLTR